MPKIPINLDNKLILCFYEGNAEKEILDMLMDNDKLIFTKKELIDEDFQKRISVKKVVQKYLKFDYDKDVAIVRVIDSKTEQFKLKKPYNLMYKEIYNCRTYPEIEYLLILYHHDEVKFKKENKKEGLKACEFCKKYYEYSKAQDKKYFQNNFNIKDLLSTLEKYDMTQPDEHTIYSLVKH